jgi:hypothetical protein
VVEKISGGWRMVSFAAVLGAGITQELGKEQRRSKNIPNIHEKKGLDGITPPSVR